MKKYRIRKAGGRWFVRGARPGSVVLFPTWQEAVDWVDEQIQTTPMEVCS